MGRVANGGMRHLRCSLLRGCIGATRASHGTVLRAHHAPRAS